MKKTEIGVIPEDWEVRELVDMVELINGRAYSQNELLSRGKYRVLRVGNFFSSDKWYWSDLELANKFYVENGDLMYAWSASFGPKFWLEEKTIYHYHIWKIDNYRKTDKKFLYHLLVNDKASIQNESQGGTMFHITKEAMEKRKFPLPPLAEQEAIASALSDADAWIERLEQLIAKKRLIKQGAMQTLLTPPSHAEPDEAWEVKKLGEVCDVRDGTHDSPKYLDSGVKFITSKNIVNNKLDFSDISYISFSDATEINKRSKVDKDDIIMSMIGTIGNAVLIDFEPDFCIKNVALLKPKNISSTFLIQMIKSPYFQNLLNSKMDGGIQKFVSLGVLRDLDFNCPKSLSVQVRIATILSDMDAELEALATQLGKARQIKQGMMQELLTGRTRLIDN